MFIWNQTSPIHIKQILVLYSNKIDLRIADSFDI